MQLSSLAYLQSIENATIAIFDKTLILGIRQLNNSKFLVLAVRPPSKIYIGIIDARNGFTKLYMLRTPSGLTPRSIILLDKEDFVLTFTNFTEPGHAKGVYAIFLDNILQKLFEIKDFNYISLFTDGAAVAIHGEETGFMKPVNKSVLGLHIYTCPVPLGFAPSSLSLIGNKRVVATDSGALVIETGNNNVLEVPLGVKEAFIATDPKTGITLVAYQHKGSLYLLRFNVTNMPEKGTDSIVLRGFRINVINTSVVRVQSLVFNGEVAAITALTKGRVPILVVVDVFKGLAHAYRIAGSCLLANLGGINASHIALWGGYSKNGVTNTCIAYVDLSIFTSKSKTITISIAGERTIATMRYVPLLLKPVTISANMLKCRLKNNMYVYSLTGSITRIALKPIPQNGTIHYVPARITLGPSEKTYRSPGKSSVQPFSTPVNKPGEQNKTRASTSQNNTATKLPGTHERGFSKPLVVALLFVSLVVIISAYVLYRKRIGGT